MPDKYDLAQYRISHADECLQNAKDLLQLGDSGVKTAVNRSYYAFFHAMRAVLALEEKDLKKHSALISYFRQNYIQTGIFPVACSKTLATLFRIRQKSDYEDFFLISKEEVALQAERAEAFLMLAKAYIEDHMK